MYRKMGLSIPTEQVKCNPKLLINKGHQFFFPYKVQPLPSFGSTLRPSSLLLTTLESSTIG